MDAWDDKELFAALRQACEEVGDDASFNETLRRAPSVTVTVRVPALELVAAQTFADAAGITRNNLMARLIGAGLGKIAGSKLVPGWREQNPPIDLAKGETIKTATWKQEAA